MTSPEIPTIEAVPGYPNPRKFELQHSVEMVAQTTFTIGRSFQRQRHSGQMTPELQAFNTLEESGSLSQVYDFLTHEQKTDQLAKLKCIFSLMCSVEHASAMAEGLLASPQRLRVILAVIEVVSFCTFSMKPANTWRRQYPSADGKPVFSRPFATIEQEENLHLVRYFLLSVNIRIGGSISTPFPDEMAWGDGEVLDMNVAKTPVRRGRDECCCVTGAEDSTLIVAHIIHHTITANKDASHPFILGPHFVYGELPASESLRLCLGPASYNAPNLLTLRSPLAEKWDNNEIVIYLDHADPNSPTGLDYDTWKTASPNAMCWVIESPIGVKASLTIPHHQAGQPDLIPNRRSLQDQPLRLPYCPRRPYSAAVERPSPLLLNGRANFQHGLHQLEQLSSTTGSVPIPVYRIHGRVWLQPDQWRDHSGDRKALWGNIAERRKACKAKIRTNVLGQTAPGLAPEYGTEYPAKGLSGSLTVFSPLHPTHRKPRVSDLVEYESSGAVLDMWDSYDSGGTHVAWNPDPYPQLSYYDSAGWDFAYPESDEALYQEEYRRHLLSVGEDIGDANDGDGADDRTLADVTEELMSERCSLT